MKKVVSTGLMLCACLGISVVALAQASGFELPDIHGAMHTLEQYKGRIVVLEWTNYDCPFVKKFYGPGLMQNMQQRYTKDDVVWLSICSSAPGKQGHFSSEQWQERIKAAGAEPTAVLLDVDGMVGRKYGASNTPHMFVVGKDGALVYQGAVDDKRTADPDSLKNARNYLADALDALLEGSAIPVAKTKAYGCSVKYAP